MARGYTLRKGVIIMDALHSALLMILQKKSYVMSSSTADKMKSFQVECGSVIDTG